MKKTWLQKKLKSIRKISANERVVIFEVKLIRSFEDLVYQIEGTATRNSS